MKPPGAPPFKWKKVELPLPGDDVVQVPPPVTEEPPQDRFCDLVLTGGVASGVVYPWAIVELARHYRFRNIGGTSVGAMAAALAAAAEYGRRTGYEDPFEALRRSPGSLATVLEDGRTRMLSLFQPNKHGKRLMAIWGKVAIGNTPGSHCPPRNVAGRAVRWTLCVYAAPILRGTVASAALAALVAWIACDLTWPPNLLQASFGFLMMLIGALAGLACALWSDILRGIIRNCYGLCQGGTLEQPGSEYGPMGITEWLHVGIQKGAGLKKTDPPLTFRDLWTAPAYPGAERRPCTIEDPPSCRSINLQMITTNVTHGRPYRLPLEDRKGRLFFRRAELEGYFPAPVLDALVSASRPYEPRISGGRDPDPNDPTAWDLRELPAEDLPVVVAARLSLSFPLLFAAVPLWAIDYEAPPRRRVIRRCIFTDGGASSNFPIHLFDAAVPRWPTFGLWLDSRTPYFRKDRDAKGSEDEEEVWLPRYNGEGWGDAWDRFDLLSKPPLDHPDVRHPCRLPSQLGQLLGFLTGIVTSAKDWHDRTSFRLPHVRNRVARILLLPGEGGLDIAMPREQILSMAHRYGTMTGKKFVARFRDQGGQPSEAWNEQRWIRFNMLVNGLRELLDGLSTRAAWSTRTQPLEQAISAASQSPGPVRSLLNHHGINPSTVQATKELLRELEKLEGVLRATPRGFSGEPKPELRLRAPL